MTEREPLSLVRQESIALGKTSFAKENARDTVVPRLISVKRFARKMLRLETPTSESFKATVVEFASTFYMPAVNSGISTGTLNKRTERIKRKARKHGLSSDDILLARFKAEEIFAKYKGNIDTNAVFMFVKQTLMRTFSKENPELSLEYSHIIPMLKSPEPLTQQRGLNLIQDLHWLPQTPEEAACFLAAKGDWNLLCLMGESSIPSLTNALRHDLSTVRQKATVVLSFLRWEENFEKNNATDEDKLFYYMARGNWSKVPQLVNESIPTILDTIHKQDDATIIRLTKLLAELHTSSTLRTLHQLAKHKDANIQRIAQGVIDMSPNWYEALLAVRPEWENFPPSEKEINNLMHTIQYLPPVGGKLLVVSSGKDVGSYPSPLDPSLTAEEQIKKLNMLRQEGKLGKGYIHQMTVQGRLPDEFKYVAVALVLHGPVINDWNAPFFAATWGTVAPMVHDGGIVRDLNPVWRTDEIKGRTDFLQRVVFVHEPHLEQLEGLETKDLLGYPVSVLANARKEQEERERLSIELKAYQRLALACHAAVNTAPVKIPPEIRSQLSIVWYQFKEKTDALLRKYGIDGAVETTWFHSTPRSNTVFKLERYEAEWPPIQKELIRLEEVHKNNPKIIDQIRQILEEATYKVDQTIGLI